MFGGFAKKIFGSSNDRYVRSLQKTVLQINALEPTISALTDDELKGQTAKLRTRLTNGEELADILPEAFATVREASVRTLRAGCRPAPRHWRAGRAAWRSGP